MSTVKARQLKAITHVFRANYDHSHGGIYAMNKGVFEKINNDNMLDVRFPMPL